MEKDLDKLSQRFSLSPPTYICMAFFPISMGKMDRNLNMPTLDIQDCFNIFNSLFPIFSQPK